MSKKKVASLAAGAAALASLAGSALAGAHTVNAEPQQYKAPLFGFGSDTTQDVVNAFAGFANGVVYTPLVTSSSTGYKQIVSFDATKPGAVDPTTERECIATKLGSPLVLRPFGSGEGSKFLSRQAGGTWYSGLTVTADITNAGCNASRSVSGLADFGRSSSGPSDFSAADLTYVPFGKDSLSFAYYKPSTSVTAEVDTLSYTQLNSIYTAGNTTLIGSTVIIPCGIQTGSGTFKSWYGKVGRTKDQSIAATALCKTVGNAADTEENNGVALKAKGDALALISDALCDGVSGGSAVSCADVQVIIGFASSSWVSKSNGASSPDPSGSVKFGRANGLKFVEYDGGQAAGSQWSPNTVANRTVTNAELTSNVVTITTSAVHGLTVGDWVQLGSLTGGFTGLNSTTISYQVVSAPTTTTFTFAKTASDIASAASAGSVITSGSLSYWNRSVYNVIISSNLATDGSGDCAIIEMFAARSSTVSNVARTGTTATITTSAAHGMCVGSTVVIASLTNSALNGTFTITAVPTTTTFRVTTASSGTIASVSDTGTAKVTPLTCQSAALATTVKFGFLTLSTCGALSTTGAYVANNG